MRAKNLATLLLAISLVEACSSVPKSAQRIPTCLTDPDNNQFHCDGDDRPWPAMKGYACFKLEDYEALISSCH